MNKDSVTVTDNRNGQQYEIPFKHATQGPDAIDIGRFYRDTGYFTYDPGFLSTASCHSSLTYLDGEQGVLQYRGYPIEQLAEHSSFIEVAYLMLYGELPKREELDNNSDYVEQVLCNGAQKARTVASKTMERVRDAIGLGAVRNA